MNGASTSGGSTPGAWTPGAPTISARTRVVALLGDPVAHSLSPAMHNSAFRACGLDWVYVAFRVPAAELPDALRGLRALGLAGCNLTIPHKQAALQWLDEVTPEAQRVGAVNTVVNRQGRLVGYNTDGEGFVRALLEATGSGVAGKRAVLLGAGGAARSVANALADGGARSVTVASRGGRSAERLASELAATFAGRVAVGAADLAVPPSEPGGLGAALEAADLLINATPVGMHPWHEEPLPAGVDLQRLPPRCTVCDLVYNPLDTRLLQAARARGLPTMDGLGMLLYQGVLAFELWTGQGAPVRAMRQALLQALPRATG